MKPILLFAIALLLTSIFLPVSGQQNIEEAIQDLQQLEDSLRELPPSRSRDSSIVMAHGRKKITGFALRDTTITIKENFENLKAHCDSSLFPQSNSYYKYLLGMNYLFDGVYNLAVDLYNECLIEFKVHGNSRMELLSYSELARIVSLTLINDPSKDHESREAFYAYTRDGLKLALGRNDTLAISSYYLNIALNHLCFKQYDSARVYYRKSWEVVQNANKEKYWFQYYGGRWAEGLSLIHLGASQKGFKLIAEVKKEVLKSKRHDHENLRLIMGYLLGEYYIERGQFNKALDETNWGYKNNLLQSNAFLKHFINKNYFRIYKAKGEYKNAIAYSEQITLFNNKLESDETKGKYIKWANTEQNIKKDNTIKTLQLKNLKQVRDRQNLVRNILLLTLLALGLIAIYIFRKNRRLKVANESLIQKKKEIETALFKGQHLERKRVASELHDTLATKVSALKWRMEALTAPLTDEEQEPFENVIKSLEEVYTDIRFISHNLLPEELERVGLENTLSNLIIKLNRLDKTKFSLIVDDVQVALDRTKQYEFYNVILELCNNILKHADAEEAFISLSEVDKKLYLTVSDNGKGFGGNIDSNGMGLQNIRNRVASLDGEVHFESSETGTKVNIIA